MPEHRLVLVERALGDGELEGGSAVLGDHRGVPAAAIVGGIDVEGAAGHDQGIDALEVVADAVRLVRQGDREAARRVDGVEIVLAQRIPGKLGIAPRLFRIQGDSNEGTGHAPRIPRS